jgi:peptidylprolyl isomerase/FKBP-type peptidyl-prolyl cis-trans isomerase FkpA
VDTAVPEQLATTDTQLASPVAVAGDQEADVARALLDATDPVGNVTRVVVDDVLIGTGPAVADGDTVEVHYIGVLQNGQEFDNSYRRGQSFTFTVGDGNVITGWEQGIVGMQAGGQRILVIPPAAGYGSEGFGPIPGDATLVFTIELLEIVE